MPQPAPSPHPGRAPAARAGEPAWEVPAAGPLDDDMVPVLAALGPRVPFALATLVARDGGPRPVGAQMVVTRERRWGLLSGGCVEGDVAAHARAALADGAPRALTYGRGSPFFDIRLPCGGRIDLLVEPVAPGDAAVARLLDLAARRRPARYLSDGRRRLCLEDGERGEPGEDPEGAGGPWTVDRRAVPPQRLAVVGSDPFALGIALAGAQAGWSVALVGEWAARPGVAALGGPPGEALARLAPDPWTAVAVASHEEEGADAALAAALRSEAGYVGALGSRRRLGERLARLKAMGVPAGALGRLRAPIGLPIGAVSPREIGAAVVAEIIAARAEGPATGTATVLGGQVHGGQVHGGQVHGGQVHGERARAGRASVGPDGAARDRAAG